ncbi:MAG TPA: ATP-binding protein [Ramlibacter sp.]|nr:ATP-binding protein [Ramlibacter sp.]
MDRLESSWPRASLRTYLVAVILLATLPLGGLMSARIFADVRDEQAQVEEELARSATALSQAVDRELASSFDALTALSQSEFVAQAHAARLGPPPRWRLRRDWDSVFMLGPGGEVLFDTASQAGPGDSGQALRELHQSVVGAAQPHVSSVAQGPAQGRRKIAVALPVVEDGKVRYVLGARIVEAVWPQLASTASMPANAHAGLYDTQGRLIGYSPAPAPAGMALPSEAAAAMRDRPAGTHRSSGIDASPVYAAWHKVALAGWQVRVTLPAAPIDAAYRKAAVAALSTAGASLLLGLLLAAVAARRVARPLHQLATQGPAGLSGPVAVREVALLRDALLRARAQDAATRDLIEGKAHEFQTLFNSSPIGMAFAHDPGCSTIWHNAAMDELIGPSDSHKTGTMRVLHDGRELAPGQQPLQRAAARGETVMGMELEIAIEGRPSTFVIANAVPLQDGLGRPRGAISALVDITQRKSVEERLLAASVQLRESQRLMELAQEAGRVGFFHYWFETDSLTWTPGQCKLFGIEALPAGCLRQWFVSMDPGDRDRVEREFWTACALRREKETLEYCVVRPDGGSRWLSSRIVLQYDGDGRAAQMTGVTVDMTDQKQAERARAQLTERALAARREAEAASRAKDEFLTMLSHELRNPLGAISAAIDVLDAAQPGSVNAAEARAIIGRQTRNLAHMMNDLLDVGRVIAGKITLARRIVNLAAIVQRVNETLALTGEAKDHLVRLELDEAWVDGDAVRIEQVVTNLLTNAIKFTPRGRSIQVSVRREDDTAVLQVQDSGLGIPATLLPRIFDLFVQGERPLHRPAGGLGIGLTLVRRLVELHGGTVGAESSGEGSRFTVRLPAVAAPPSQDSAALPASRRRKVLVIEDNDDVLAALRSKLELDGHTVSTAADGIEGLTRLLKLRPEVSIVDIGLPGLTGYELARHARAAGYSGRMIALSGYGAERDAKAALVAGFDAYLVKPVDRNQLRATLSSD